MTRLRANLMGLGDFRRRSATRLDHRQFESGRPLWETQRCQVSSGENRNSGGITLDVWESK